jgi:Tfp pilus assembly protein PilO
MNRDKLINLGVGGGIVLVLIFGWLIGVSPILDQSALAKTTEASMVTANQTSEARLALLKKQFTNLSTLQTQLAGLHASVPETADIPAFLAEINAQSVASGVTLTSLTVNDAAFVSKPEAPATAGAATTDATPAPTASDSTAAATTTPVATPTTGSGLISIPVKVLVSGPYASVMNFAGAMQTGSRLFFVASLNLSGSGTDASFTGELDGNVYVLPSSTGSPATTTPTKTPAPSTTPTPSSTVPANPSGTPTSTPTPTGTAKP